MDPPDDEDEVSGYEYGDDLCDFVDEDCETAWEQGPVGDEI